MNEAHDDPIDALLRKQFDGPIPDDGFSERLMQQLPLGRRRIAWPLWVSIVAGVATCWWGLMATPLLHIGARDLLGGRLSASSVLLVSIIAGMSLLTCWWTLAEADNR